jgi:hypothetical protein
MMVIMMMMVLLMLLEKEELFVVGKQKKLALIEGIKTRKFAWKWENLHVIRFSWIQISKKLSSQMIFHVPRAVFKLIGMIGPREVTEQKV